MNEYFGFSPSWPDELKKAWYKQNKLRYKLRCLDGCMSRADYDDFEITYSEWERVQKELLSACIEFERLYTQHSLLESRAK